MIIVIKEKENKIHQFKKIVSLNNSRIDDNIEKDTDKDYGTIYFLIRFRIFNFYV